MYTGGEGKGQKQKIPASQGLRVLFVSREESTSNSEKALGLSLHGLLPAWELQELLPGLLEDALEVAVGQRRELLRLAQQRAP